VVSGEIEAHRETAKAWDIVAKAKYDAEFDEHVEQLRLGNHNLLGVEIEIIGPLVRDAQVINLQCSHGLDALGLINAGAASVLGVDISPEMVRQARAKAAAIGSTSAEFLIGDVTDLPAELDATADIIYTGRGSLPWILDIGAWSRSVSRLLRPGGYVFIFEGHPLDALWDREATGLELQAGASYFEHRARDAPGFPASVVARAGEAARPIMLERQWRPDQVIEVLLTEGLELRIFREYPVLFWDQFPKWPGELKERLPHSYALLFQAPAQ
jgi:SAM-dependent methyltransferase